MSAHLLFSGPAHQAGSASLFATGAAGAAPPVSLGAHERAILNGLAAHQLRYGKTEEALQLLGLTRQLWAEDAQTLRLLTQAHIQRQSWREAEAADAALRRVSALTRRSPFDRLREALIHFGQARLHEARLALEAALGLERDARRG